MSYISGFTGPLIAKRVRDAIILNLRSAFATDVKYPYATNGDGSVNFDCAKIVINDATPEDHYFLPSINVMTLGGDEFRFLQEDFMEEYENDAGNKVTRRGAPLSLSVTIEATALDVITRDELLDRMYQRFKIVTDDLAENGVAVVKTSLIRDRRTLEKDRWFYTSGVEMALYAEWIEEEATDVSSTIDKFKTSISTTNGINQEFRI